MALNVVSLRCESSDAIGAKRTSGERRPGFDRRLMPQLWTGRALQAESVYLEVIGLALLYPALERNVCVPGHHGYPRASDLILGKAHRGRSCHQIMDATARPFLHLFIPARRPRRESRLMLLGSA